MQQGRTLCEGMSTELCRGGREQVNIFEGETVTEMSEDVKTNATTDEDAEETENMWQCEDVTCRQIHM